MLLSTAHEFVEHIKNMLASLAYYRNQSLNYVKLIARIQKKKIQNFKLISFGGIAADNDKTVRVRFQINCKDKFLDKAIIQYPNSAYSTTNRSELLNTIIEYYVMVLLLVIQTILLATGVITTILILLTINLLLIIWVYN